jgi:large subunit ribosomal protein L21
MAARSSSGRALAHARSIDFMYAIIQDGGHQYKVEAGQVCRMQIKDATEGASITFDKVAFVGGDLVKVGAPYISGASVKATVLRQEVKGDKVIIGFYRRRKNSRRKVGHRQKFTEVKIDSIDV